jgi:hypothetical protein
MKSYSARARSSRRRRRNAITPRRGILLAATAGALPLLPISAEAVDRYWVGGSGNWVSAPTQWSATPGGVGNASIPTTGDNAIFNFSDFGVRQIIYNTTSPGFLNGLTLNDTNGLGNVILNQSQGELNVTGEVVGNTGFGVFNLNTGGSNNATTLTLGATLSGNGTYNLTGGTLLSNEQRIGMSGLGTVNHNGGVNNVTTQLILGANIAGTNGSYGIYNLVSGNLQVGGTASGSLIVGNSGTGAFNQSNGATIVGDQLTIGMLGTGFGIYTLNGGTLTARNQVIGNLSTGQSAFIQNGGSNTAVFVRIANDFGSDGRYDMNGGTLTVQGDPFSSIYVGSLGNGVFNLNGGTVSASSVLVSAAFAGTGTVNISAGSLQTVGLSVGNNNRGTVNQTGGTVSADNLSIAPSSSSAGTNVTPSLGFYNLGPGATLTAKVATIGGLGNATFVQSGGDFTVSQAGGGTQVLMAQSSNSVSSYSLQGGTLSVVGSNAREYMGYGGNVTFTQSGGAHSVGNWLYMGFLPTGVGKYTLSGGTLSSPGQSVGYRSTAESLFTQSGGTNTASSFITIGDQAGALGRYEFQNGQLNPLTLNVGWDGTGVLHQANGTLNTSSMRVGMNASADGAVTLDAGAINVSQSSYVGNGGSGTFVQNGGTHTFTTGNFAGLFIGYSPGSSGTYTLNNGTLNVSQNFAEIYVGFQGQGTLNQNGGNVSAYYFTTGYYKPGSGVYNQKNGTLDAQFHYVGWYGDGVVNHSGGTSTARQLLIGYNQNSGTTSAATGQYFLSGGRLSLSEAEYVGISATGSMRQTGGTHTVGAAGGNTGELDLGNAVQGQGTFDLAGGSLTVNGHENIGNFGSGVFNQGGGVHNVTDTIYVARNAGSSGQFNLTGGSLTARVNVGLGGSLNQTFGTLNVTGEVTNFGTYNYDGPGAFNGSLLQMPAGTLNVNGPMTLSGAVTNTGTINVAGATPLIVNGAGGLGNDGGLINLNGGSLGGTGPLINNGQISGYGTISGSGGLTNYGQITQSDGGNLVFAKAGGMANNGSIDLAPGRQVRIDGPFNNLGTLRLNSGFVGGAGPLTNASGGLIVGPGAINSPLVNAGGIYLDNGSLNVLLPFTNSGSITLDHAAAHLSGAPLNNTGIVQGRGFVSNNFSNGGTVDASGGVLTLSGAFSNGAGGLVRAQPGAKVVVLNGLAVNTGTIDLFGGAFDNNGKPLANAGTISGHGTLLASSLTNAGTIALTAGDSDLFGPIDNSAAGKVIVTGGAAANFHHALTGAAGAEIRVSSNSAAVFLGPVTGPFTFTGVGTKYFEAGASAVGPVAAGGATIVQGAASLTADLVREQSLTVRGDVTLRPGGGTSKVNELTIAPGGTLDLADNPLIVDYTGASPINAIRGNILTAYSGGSWTGEGLTSSTAASQSRLALGYGESSTILGAGGGTFGGLSVDGSAVLVRLTIKGDANLDNTVDFVDLVALAQHYNTSDGSQVWTTGDFTYDGNVDFSDLVALAQNYNTSLPAGPIAGASADFAGDLARAFQSVPEPGALVCVPVGAALFIRGRRRTPGRRR